MCSTPCRSLVTMCAALVASTGVAQAMYDQGQWSSLTDALAKVKEGDGTDLMALADAYASRDPDGNYSNNLLEAFFAISCLDNPDSPDAATYEQRAKAFAAKAPTWGAMMAWILNQRYLCHGQNGQGTTALNGTDPTTSSARNIRPNPRPYGAGP